MSIDKEKIIKENRRYPQGKKPAYDSEFERLNNSSPILNQSAREYDIRNVGVVAGLGNLNGSLAQLKGISEKDGFYLEGTTWKRALIPAAKQSLKAVKHKYKRWQRDEVRSGNALKPPKNWPDNLLKEKLKNEAVLDVRQAEKEYVEALIKDWKISHKKFKEMNVLPYGPLGQEQDAADNINRPWKIDGQKISRNGDGVPFIDEPSSKYHGLPVFLYRRMSKIWRKEMGLMPDQLREKRDKIFEQEKSEAHKAGKPVPTKRLKVTPNKMGEWVKRLGITESDWPKFPDDAEKIS